MAVVLIDAASDPDSGSVVASEVITRLGSGQRGQPALLLFLGAQHHDGVGEEAVGAHQVSDARIAPAQLLLHQALGEDVGEATAAELLGDHEVGDADGGRLCEDVHRGHHVGLVDLAGPGPDLLGREVVAQFDDLALLVGERPGRACSLSIEVGMSISLNVGKAWLACAASCWLSWR